MKDNTRPKKNQIYLHHRYRDPIEQNFDMIFFNEKYYSELWKYDMFDDHIPEASRMVEDYKTRLAELLKVPKEQAQKLYMEYCKMKVEKLKRIAEINVKWYQRERAGIGLSLDNLEDFGKDKRELQILQDQLGAWRCFLSVEHKETH